jgi:uncharacterized protein (TIGR00369 family)
MDKDDAFYGDRKAIAARLAGLSGRQALELIIAGRLPPPPIAGHLGFRLAEAKEGWARFTGTPMHEAYNPLGSIHGGWLATLIDSAVFCAVHATLAPGETYTTASLELKFCRAVTVETGPVDAVGAIIHRGRRLATAEARLTDSAGRLYAHGLVTCFIQENA